MDDIESLLPYDEWMVDGMRRIIYFSVWHVSEYGLPGDHHLYITFKTQHPDVHISPNLRARFPEEMRIVIQHQYSNLDVDEEKFSITLQFGSVPEKLVIPYVAISQFLDAAVHFALDFDIEIPPSTDIPIKPNLRAVDTSGNVSQLSTIVTEKSAEPASSAEVKSAPENPKAGKKKSSQKNSTGKVVTLDAFRQMKKENKHE